MKEKFNLDGHYNYINLSEGKAKLQGEIYVGKNGFFEGEIEDFGSEIKTQTLKGYFKDQQKMNLRFFKSPKEKNLANLIYNLEKGEKGIEGKYFGEWRTIPFKVSIVGEYMISLTSFDMNVLGVGDYAEINISKS